MRLRDTIGILDLQGGVHEHVEHFARVGIKALRVKRAEEFDRLAGLVLPGGESTCMARLLRIFHLDAALKSAHRNGMKLWGTCAGAILLAREIVGEPAHLALVDITVQRNAFGSQLESFTRTVPVPALTDTPQELVFIRAPKIVRAGAGVHTLLELDGFIAAAETSEVLLTVFHPELSPSLAFHRRFATLCGLATLGVGDWAEAWTRTSWMA
jgi:pyridoxal 5'-phosphate synthase pdxT subunit